MYVRLTLTYFVWREHKSQKTPLELMFDCRGRTGLRHRTNHHTHRCNVSPTCISIGPLLMLNTLHTHCHCNVSLSTFPILQIIYICLHQSTGTAYLETTFKWRDTTKRYLLVHPISSLPSVQSSSLLMSHL